MNAQFLFRRRLVNIIESSGNQVTYIYGPASFGKTTIARQWAESKNERSIYFEGFSSLSSASILKKFIESLIEGLPKLAPLLSEIIVDNDVDQTIIENLIEILNQEKNPYTLIIDNAEHIRQNHVKLSQIFVQNRPDKMKLILITATSPSAEFIRSYGIDRLCVISPEQLKFTKEEIFALAQHTYPDISKDDVQNIFEYTEGWPAGVQLLLSQISNANDSKKVFLNFKSKGKKEFTAITNRVIAEINAQQIELITRLCLSNVIDTDTVNILGDNADAVRQLTILSQESIAVSQIDSSPPRFKIHPLLRETLIDELRKRSDFHEIVEKTIKNLLGRDRIREATEILIELGETSRLAQLLKDQSFVQAIDSSIQDSIARGEVSDLQSWLSVTPYMPNIGKIGFSVLNFYISLLQGNFNEAQTHIHNTEATLSSLGKELRNEWTSDVLAMQSILHFANGRLSENWNCALEALEWKKRYPTNSRHQLTYLQFALWSALLRDSDVDLKNINQFIDEISAEPTTPQKISTIRMMRSLQAAHDGRFTEARNNLLVAMTPISQSRYRGFFGAYAIKMAEAYCFAEAGKTSESIVLFEELNHDAIQGRNFPIAIASYGRLAFLYFISGDSEKALDTIRKAREMVDDKLLSPELHGCIDVWEMRIRLNLQDFERVQELLSRSKSTYMVKAFEAAINIEKSPSKTRALLDTFDLKSPRQAMTYHLFNAHLLYDSPSKQLNEVRKAVDIGSIHGYFRIFLLQRSDVIQHYITLAAESPTAFNERLARAAGERLNEMMFGQGDSPESLTRREADILRHLATGLPLKDIAGNLNISKNTIKSHLRNLYRKLGATDREDAVEKGKKLLKV